MKHHRLPIITAATWPGIIEASILILVLMSAIVLVLVDITGCGGEIDPAGAVRAESASGTWAIEPRRGF